MPIEKPNTRSISSQTKTITTPTPTQLRFNSTNIKIK